MIFEPDRFCGRLWLTISERPLANQNGCSCWRTEPVRGTSPRRMKDPDCFCILLAGTFSLVVDFPRNARSFEDRLCNKKESRRFRNNRTGNPILIIKPRGWAPTFTTLVPFQNDRWWTVKLSSENYIKVAILISWTRSFPEGRKFQIAAGIWIQ